MLSDRFAVLTSDLAQMVWRLDDARDDVRDVTEKSLELGPRAAGQRPTGHDSLEGAGIGRADQPDPVPRHELDVVGAATEQSRILEGTRDAGAVLVFVDEQQDVLVIAEIVSVTDRSGKLLHRQALGGITALDLVQLGGGFRQVGGDAELLHIAAEEPLIDLRGHIPPASCVGVGTADEYPGRGRERRLTDFLAARLGRAGADVGAVAVVNEPDLVDALGWQVNDRIECGRLRLRAAERPCDSCPGHGCVTERRRGAPAFADRLCSGTDHGRVAERCLWGGTLAGYLSRSGRRLRRARWPLGLVDVPAIAHQATPDLASVDAVSCTKPRRIPFTLRERPGVTLL